MRYQCKKWKDPFTPTYVYAGVRRRGRFVREDEVVAAKHELVRPYFQGRHASPPIDVPCAIDS